MLLDMSHLAASNSITNALQPQQYERTWSTGFSTGVFASTSVFMLYRPEWIIACDSCCHAATEEQSAQQLDTRCH